MGERARHEPKPGPMVVMVQGRARCMAVGEIPNNCGVIQRNISRLPNTNLIKNVLSFRVLHLEYISRIVRCRLYNVK